MPVVVMMMMEGMVESVPVLSVLCVNLLDSYRSPAVRTAVLPISKIRKLRLREVR